MTVAYKFTGIDCPACGAKIESKIAKIKGVEEANLSFMSKKVVIELKNDNIDELFPQIIKACKKVCPECELTKV